MQHLRSTASVLLISVWILTLSSCLNQSAVQNKEQNQQIPFELGMSEEDFLDSFPDARKRPEDQYLRNSREFGIRGEWLYSFHKGRLGWYIFSAQETDISEANFNRTFEAANRIIESYRSIYGSPWREDSGYTVYLDPKIKTHRGYKVRGAHWKTEKGELVVDFTFLGNGGVYSLLLTVQRTS